ncbi:MAG: prepilin-type N-terminal cleavage/methylation domain-containing protein [Bacilli bacterium]|nr:prepilin-type N-terminal cleavage/methylation domain-containing protein [Bacilli bacterium]
MKNKKGFTLIELLAVIVVLVIITVLAINKISSVMKKNNENSVKANALTFFKAVEENAGLSRVTGTLTDGLYSTSELNELGIKLSGTYPNSGAVQIENGKIKAACLVYSKFYVSYSDGNITNVEKGNCNSFEAEVAYNFDYTGSEQIFTAQKTGTYKLEAWGAQGGDSYYNSYYNMGGYGGYSVGKIHLNKGDKLYINVGGQGTSVNYAQSSGTVTYSSDTGYNGGGFATKWDNNSSHGGGGGATSIATTSGLLSTLSSNLSDILIVAGGGGGSSTHSSYPSYSGRGGSGGGYIAGNGVSANSTCYNYGNGGSQTAAGSFTACSSDGTSSRSDNPPSDGSFGKGSNFTSNQTSNCYAGGGGGYYGGGSAWHAPGGGGSGYIGNSLLSSKEMKCYGCTESNSPDTKTSSVDCAEETANSSCAKKGNGYVKISLVNV